MRKDFFQSIEEAPIKVQNLVRLWKTSDKGLCDAEELKDKLEMNGFKCSIFSDGVPQQLNIIEPEDLFARKCSATGKGMNKGHVFEFADLYFSNEEDVINHLRKDDPEATVELSDDFLLEEAYDMEDCYYTEWDELDEDEAYDEDGNAYELINDLWTKI
jgi:hypothetical protein